MEYLEDKSSVFLYLFYCASIDGVTALYCLEYSIDIVWCNGLPCTLHLPSQYLPVLLKVYSFRQNSKVVWTEGLHSIVMSQNLNKSFVNLPELHIIWVLIFNSRSLISPAEQVVRPGLCGDLSCLISTARWAGGGSGPLARPWEYLMTDISRI